MEYSPNAIQMDRLMMLNLTPEERMTTSHCTRSDTAAVVWAALAKLAAKEGARECLIPGTSRHIHLKLSGEVDGQPFQHQVNGVLAVGHDQKRATSSVPELAKLLATILAKLNANTRSKILRELPREFERNGSCLPDVESALVEMAERLLRQLRSKRTVIARGSVSLQYQHKTDEPETMVA